MPSSPGREHGSVTPESIAAWEARRYDRLRRLRAAAAATPIDDALPEDPAQVPTAARAALRDLD